MGTEMNIDAERAAAFEEAAKICEAPCVGTEGEVDEEITWILRNRAARIRSLAGRRTSASIDEDGLPELPAPEYAQMNVLSHGMVSVQCGYTADQMRQYALDAIADDRRARRPRVKLDPELMAALDEAAKTRSTGTLLPDGSAVFINYGHDYGDNAHLECTACGGSGHIDDQLLIAGQSGEESPQAAQGVSAADAVSLMLWLYRRLPRAYGRPPHVEAPIAAMAKIAGIDVADSFSERDPAPPLSSEPQAGKGESACGS